MKSKANGRLSRREFLAASVATSGVAILFAAGVAAQEHTPVADHLLRGWPTVKTAGWSAR